MTVTAFQSPFDALKRVALDGTQYWDAREMLAPMGYDSWRRFAAAIQRARESAANQGIDVEKAFCRTRQEVTGGRPAENFHLTREACYLIAMNGDPRKP